MHRWNGLLLMVLITLLVSSCARNPERFYFGAYSEAEHLYHEGEYESAIQKYQQYIDENPEGNMAVISKYYIAKSRQSIGQVDEAKTIYRDIIQNYPDVVWANFAQTQLNEMGS